MNTFRMLLAEDDGQAAAALTRLLKRVNGSIEVITVKTLADALACSTQLRANVTLLDPNLEDTNDWHEAIHAIPRFNPPVIVVTGMDDPNREVMLEAFKYGAQNVFYKPYEMKVVEQLVSSATAAHLRVVMPERLKYERLSDG